MAAGRHDAPVWDGKRTANSANHAMPAMLAETDYRDDPGTSLKSLCEFPCYVVADIRLITDEIKRIPYADQLWHGKFGRLFPPPQQAPPRATVATAEDLNTGTAVGVSRASAAENTSASRRRKHQADGQVSARMSMLGVHVEQRQCNCAHMCTTYVSHTNCTAFIA